MPEVEKKSKTPAGAEAKEPKAKKEKAPKPEGTGVPRTNFSSIWPENQPIKVLVAANPKKNGSKSRERFEHYFGSATVGDYLAKGGTYQDLAYDVGRQFVQVG
jgi:hypothetical protein